MSTTAHLNVNGKNVELEHAPATVGESGLRISNLRSESGYVTLDPGFGNTASCESAITYIDGEKGILRYRGYPIEQLAANCTFLEVAYLLIFGELPDAASLSAFTRRIKRHTHLHEDFKSFFTAFPSHGHPMAVLQAGIAGLATYYEDTTDPFDEDQLNLASVLLIAKTPTMISYISKRSTGLPLLYPDANRSYVEDFIRMTFDLPYESRDIDPVMVNALDKLLLLHADHEQNCSTSTVRMVGSSHASIYASVAAGVGALSGPLHGGANESVVAMLKEIQDSGISVKEYVSQVKDKKNNIRLMGFGHRIYKQYDPRAAIVKDLADEVIERLKGDSELFDLAKELETTALDDDYFRERNLYPNVDFYTGLIYKAMGFPAKMFTPLFALGRLPGWIAQYRELINDPGQKIGRPRQVYVGEVERTWVPVSERTKQGREFQEDMDYQV